jgi:thioredoxin-related protein
MSLKSFLCATVFAATSVAATAGEVQLVMVEQPGCAYCAAWKDEIGVAYPKTAEGAFAPLVLADLHVGPPEGTDYARRVNFTPTFILTDDGQELARIEGYPGENFFWPILSKLLQDNTEFRPPTN